MEDTAARDPNKDGDDTGSGLDQYPPYVADAKARHRWDLCRGIAVALFEDEIDGSEADVWMATRSLFNSDLPT